LATASAVLESLECHSTTLYSAFPNSVYANFKYKYLEILEKAENDNSMYSAGPNWTQLP
jgi:hypothetical protein